MGKVTRCLLLMYSVSMYIYVHVQTPDNECTPWGVPKKKKEEEEVPTRERGVAECYRIASHRIAS